MPFIVSLLTFVAVFLIVTAICMLMTKQYRVTSTRLRGLTSSAQTKADTPATAVSKEDSMPTVTRLLSGRRLTERLYVALSAAGLPMRPSEFIGVVAGSVIASQFVAVLVVRNIFGYILFAAVGAAIPIIVLKSLQHKRRLAFDSQIVDALMLMASSLRSGFSFLRAMQMVAQEMPPPISQEFERVIKEVNVGRSMEDALRSVVARVKSYDFDLVVTAVLIQHQVGGNLADILDTIASTIRERVRIMGEMRALTAEGRISGVVLVALPIILGAFITAVRPEYISTLYRETIGHYLIGIAVVLQIIGALVIKRMLVLDI